MGIITPESFAEGDLTSTTNLTSSDEKWSSLHGGVNGLNIRNEGLDIRVIKSNAWAEYSDTDGMQNFIAAESNYLNFPTTGVDLSNPVFITGYTAGTGGTDDGSRAQIRATWERDKTQAIMVRASFYVRWECGAMQTSSHGYDRIATASKLQIALQRWNNRWSSPSPLDDHAPERATVDLAEFRLSEAWAGYAYDSVSNIEFAFDRRGNLFGCTTLIDLITPEEIWEGTSDIEFNWLLGYAHGLSRNIESSTGEVELSDSPPGLVGAYIDSVNMFAKVFNK